MTFSFSVQPVYTTFRDSDGSPLDAGYIYIGQANLSPMTSPLPVFWDLALTEPAQQPIRTNAGYPVRNGSPARIYVGSDYSIQVRNKKNALVYSAATAADVPPSQLSFAPTVQSFSGNGSNATFTLIADPGSAAALVVRISGVVQTPGADYNVSGTVLTFTEAPPLGSDNVVVQNFGVAAAVGTASASSVNYLDASTLDQYIGPLTGSAKVRVDLATGFVGINTGSPTTLLDVVGANGDSLQFRSATRTTGIGTIGGLSTLYAGAGTELSFNIGGEVARLKPGVFALGAVPSAWGSGIDALQLGSASVLYNASGPALGYNTRNDGAVNRYLGNDVATIYSQASGVHRWFSAASGVAGDPITFNSLMDLSLANGLRLYGAASGFVGFAAPASGGNATYTFPGAAGSSGQFLTTTGSGVLNWTTLALNAISAGDSNITVNDSGANSTFTFALDGTTVGTWNNRILGIGHVPNAAWGSSYRGIEGPGWALAGFSSLWLELLNNVYNTGTGYVRKASGWAQQFTMNSSTGVVSLAVTSDSAAGAVSGWVNLFQTGSGSDPIFSLNAGLALNNNGASFAHNSATHTIGNLTIVRYGTTNCTVTLPNPATWRGRLLFLSNVGAFSVTSASANVCPQGSDTPGTAILSAVSGKWALLAADPNASDWKIIMSN